MIVGNLMQKEVMVRCQATKQCLFYHYSPVYSSVINNIAKFSEQEDRAELTENSLGAGLETEKLIS